MNAINHKLARFFTALMLISLCGMAWAAETDETIDLDLGEDLEFIEIDEILDEDENAPVLIVTHEISHEDLMTAIKELPKTKVLKAQPLAIRIEAI